MLGIDIRMIVESQHMKESASSLTPTLVALHIESCWENLPATATEFRPLVGDAPFAVRYLIHLLW
jgi:hypothetical protein